LVKYSGSGSICPVTGYLYADSAGAAVKGQVRLKMFEKQWLPCLPPLLALEVSPISCSAVSASRSISVSLSLRNAF